MSSTLTERRHLPEVDLRRRLTFKSFDPLDESGPITLSALPPARCPGCVRFTTTPQITSTSGGPSPTREPLRPQNFHPALIIQPALTPTSTATLNAFTKADHQRPLRPGRQSHDNRLTHRRQTGCSSAGP